MSNVIFVHVFANYCQSEKSVNGLFFFIFTPDTSGCLGNSQHSWAPMTVSEIVGHYHTSYYRAKTQLREIENYLDFYRFDYGKFPSSKEGLKAIRLIKLKNYKFNENIILDPHGKPYNYRLTKEEYKIYSYGLDNKPGGNTWNADIVFIRKFHRSSNFKIR